MTINNLCNYIYISELSAFIGAVHITKGRVFAERERGRE
jgi:hypothetical protein